MAMVMTVRGMDSMSEAGHGWGGEVCVKPRGCGAAVFAALLLEERGGAGGAGEFTMERRIVVSSRAAPQSEGAWSNVSPVEPVHHYICQLPVISRAVSSKRGGTVRVRHNPECLVCEPVLTGLAHTHVVQTL